LSRFKDRLRARYPALAHREFRRYFTGQSIALIGSFAHGVGVGWLGYRLTGSVALLGALGFVQMAPALFVSPIAGLIADRYPRRILLLGMLSSVSVLGLIMVALTASDLMTPALLLALSAVRGLIFSCEVPIRHAFIGDMIRDRALLPNAVALHSTALNAARFVGPAVGGLLVGSFGEAACLALHPVTLCATLWQLHRIRTPDAVILPRSEHSFAKQFIDGWRHAFGDRVIHLMLIGVFLMGFGVGPYSALMPAAVAELHGEHPELVGMFISCAGGGAMTAALLLASGQGVQHLQRTALIGNLSAGLGLMAFAFGSWIPLAVLGMAMVGFGTIAQAICTNMTIQTTVDDRFRARVLAIYTGLFIGGMPLGSLVFGQLGQWVGAAHALQLGATLALSGAALTLFRMRSSRQPD
jgi:MFS family permease